MSNLVVRATPVKYSDIEYGEGFVTITQNRTRRRVYDGFHFTDTGAHIYVSTYIAKDIFQCGGKSRLFNINTDTKEWSEYSHVEVNKHAPEVISEFSTTESKELIR